INSSVSAEFSYGSIGMHRITFFYNHLDDMIDFKLIDFNNDYWRGRYAYQNIESARTQGIEWESRVRLGQALDFSLAYNFLDTKILASADSLEVGRELTNRPRHTLKFFLTGYASKWGVGATFWGNYHSRKLWVPRSNTGGNEGLADEYAPARTTLNLNLFKRFHHGMEAFVRLENLLDETNVKYGYWPGFQVFAGFTYGINKEL
ncbi:MAG: TonB-dependent receptor, partial [Candidatus Zixiibacteriota bacterium]